MSSMLIVTAMTWVCLVSLLLHSLFPANDSQYCLLLLSTNPPPPSIEIQGTPQKRGPYGRLLYEWGRFMLHESVRRLQTLKIQLCLKSWRGRERGGGREPKLAEPMALKKEVPHETDFSKHLCCWKGFIRVQVVGRVIRGSKGEQPISSKDLPGDDKQTTHQDSRGDKRPPVETGKTHLQPKISRSKIRPCRDIGDTVRKKRGCIAASGVEKVKDST